mmetsp:Transcript_16622/g.14475  ORF Transcript_16622/g.14475 Transcript_16622/m.14475 type:complete len:94 (+) Transcript_16622:288-569(+)
MLYSKTPTLNIEGQNIERLVHFVHTDKDGNNILNEIGISSKDGVFAMSYHREEDVSDQVIGVGHSFEYCERNICEYILLQYRSGEIHQYEILD